jgi:exodeoxyribonuclease III
MELCSPETSSTRIQTAVREAGQFTFWDYSRMAFEHNRGIRIDHFLLSPKLAGRLKSCEIDKGPRALAKRQW